MEETKSNRCLLVLRNDREKSKTRISESELYDELKRFGYAIEKTDTVVNFNVDRFNRENVLYSKLKQIARSKLVVTDRLHGMIFAYITKTPCLLLETYNHKVTGQYEWVKNSNSICLVNDESDFQKKIKYMKNLDNQNGFNFSNVEDKVMLILEVIKKHTVL